MSSGEEYELVFTLSHQKAKSLLSSGFSKNICPVSVIGSMTSGDKILLHDTKKGEVPLLTTGWNHFS